MNKENTPFADQSFPTDDSLLLAAKDQSYINQFYTDLLANELFVITGVNKAKQTDPKDIQEGEQVSLLTFNDGRIPVFTAPSRIFDGNHFQERVNFLPMNIQDIHEMLPDKTLILNPFSEIGKEMLPVELQDLFDGKIFGEHQAIDVDEQNDGQMRIGIPEDIPSAMKLELIDLLGKHAVELAYFAIYYTSEEESLPHWLLALQHQGNLEEIANLAGPIMQRHLPEGSGIEFLELNEENQHMAQFFQEKATPFFNK